MSNTQTRSPRIKITYATMDARSDELHQAFDEALQRVRQQLGQRHPMYINGQARYAGEEFESRSPIDTRMLIGAFQKGTRDDMRSAIAAAQEAFPAWSSMPWQERVQIMRRAADMISDAQFDLAAFMALDMGKNRLETLGDVEETADLIRYYCDRMEEHNGFERPLESTAPNEQNFSVLRPFGVWGVISPFNFPMALAGGPAGAALIAGNAVVIKPSSDAPVSAIKFTEILLEAGVPAGAVNTVTGPGSGPGAELVENSDVAGMTFTGSYEVGFNIYKEFSREFTRPCITELGGKNPTIVSRHADLDRAVEGVARAAFGASGQKCSACSRVYVEAPVKDEFVRRLVERTKQLTVGDPSQRDVFMGPVVHEKALQTFQAAVEEARRDGGKVLAGGETLRDGDFAHGYFAAPTIVDGLPKEHRLFRDELFVPFLMVGTIDSYEEGLEHANSTNYGLTAGAYTQDENEVQLFLNRIEAGVVYVNRAAGATTGAWPGVQSFGGWKASGSTGRGGGGPYYLQQFMREQSRTIIR